MQELSPLPELMHESPVLLERLLHQRLTGQPSRVRVPDSGV